MDSIIKHALDVARMRFAEGGSLADWHEKSHPLTKDEGGAPRTYYTGTSKDVPFEHKKAGFKIGRHGAWFTSDPKEASRYAEQNDSQGYKRDGWNMVKTNTASRVIPAHLRAENPYTGDLPDEVRDDNYKKLQSDWFDTLRAKGHDAWIPASNKGNLAVILGHPGQIKSSISATTYDPTSGDIGKAEGGVVDRALRVARGDGGDVERAMQTAAKVKRERKAGSTSSATTHPAWIPTRLVTSKKLTSGPNDIVDLPSMKATPGGVFEDNVDLLRSYPNVTRNQARMTHGRLSAAFINHVKDNLLSLHDNVPEDIKNRSKLWYDGARAITDRWAQQYGLPDHSIAGALAALSPQKDWYQNVSLAHRVIEAMRGHGGNYYHGFAATPEMGARLQQLGAMNKPEYAPIWEMMQGKSLADLDHIPGLSDEARARAKAFWIRLHDETYNDKSHPIVTPEGGFGSPVLNANGSPAKVGWGSLGEIAKAIQSIEAANDPQRLSKLMGERHKVRNFYNNILNPNSPNGDVTIDTHAVAAGLLRPLSGNSVEVAHNFNNSTPKGVPAARGSALTGIQGLYPIYADAYRRAAKERGILPREMQSITWEAVRGLFPDTFKTEKNNAAINDIWNKYRNGSINQDEARRQVYDFAGGIRPPSWYVGGTP